ncbi:MAG: hypothetical protein NZ777_18360, partial [Pseudomonadales bacterium]|nr:hypothetical protein [Pseudomonadales bacterium]
DQEEDGCGTDDFCHIHGLINSTRRFKDIGSLGEIIWRFTLRVRFGARYTRQRSAKCRVQNAMPRSNGRNSA